MLQNIDHIISMETFKYSNKMDPFIFKCVMSHHTYDETSRKGDQFVQTGKEERRKKIHDK